MSTHAAKLGLRPGPRRLHQALWGGAAPSSRGERSLGPTLDVVEMIRGVGLATILGLSAYGEWLAVCWVVSKLSS